MRGQPDRLMTLIDSFDYIWSEEGQGQYATDVAGVSFLPVRDVSYRGGAALCQVIDPTMGVGDQGDQLCVRGRGSASTRLHHELGFDALAHSSKARSHDFLPRISLFTTRRATSRVDELGGH